MEQIVGTHIIAELTGCNRNVLGNMKEVECILLAAAREAGARVIDSSFHKFSPEGVSGVVVIAESHITIHTWPKERYAAIDIFTCGSHTFPDRAVSYAQKALGGTIAKRQSVARGIPHRP